MKRTTKILLFVLLGILVFLLISIVSYPDLNSEESLPSVSSQPVNGNSGMDCAEQENQDYDCIYEKIQIMDSVH